MSPQDIKSRRQALGLSQAQFGAALGMSTRSVEEWEAGRRAPPGLLALALAQLEATSAPVRDEITTPLAHEALDLAGIPNGPILWRVQQLINAKAELARERSDAVDSHVSLWSENCHKELDRRGAPRTDPSGQGQLNLYGRICALREPAPSIPANWFEVYAAGKTAGLMTARVVIAAHGAFPGGAVDNNLVNVMNAIDDQVIKRASCSS